MVVPSLGLRDKELEEGHDGVMVDRFKRIDIGEPKVGGWHDDIYLDATAVGMESREAAVEVLVRRPAESGVLKIEAVICVDYNAFDPFRVAAKRNNDIDILSWQ